MNNRANRLPVVLSIAGSDNTAGAGIQADIKTCSALGVYCATVITAVTAQNHFGLKSIGYVGDEMLSAQLAAIYECMRPDAVKIGLLPNANAIRIIAEKLKRERQKNIVVDPVLSATAGGRLDEDGAQKKDALRSILFPIADVITPNVPELYELAQMRPSEKSVNDCVAKLFGDYAPRHIIVKGGHSEEAECKDILYSYGMEGIAAEVESPRIDCEHTHGTGCTFSSAIAAELAKGNDVNAALKVAKQTVTQAIVRGSEFTVTESYGPVHQFPL